MECAWKQENKGREQAQEPKWICAHDKTYSLTPQSLVIAIYDGGARHESEDC